MAKRALIVDDSKSARLSLARMLEKHGIEVDTAESAELALDYLGTHRPDAIFMDHMMSGMDGLQAVQAIKNNPRTATIPIMMYTSQEGALYVGQARALGAIGVLPKEVKPADVTKVLYQLNLAVERRSAEITHDDSHTHTSTHPITYVGEPGLHGGGLREQLNDLRRTVLAGFDSQGDRLLADMRAALRETHPPQTEAPVVPVRRPWLPWVLTGALAAACVGFAVLFWQQGARLSQMQEELAQLKAATLPAAPIANGDSASAPAGVATTDANPGTGVTDPAPAQRAGIKPIVQTVPYGAEPFSGARLDTTRQLFDRLTAQGFQGTIDIKSYSGRFCLVGNATDGYSLAPDDLPYAKCDTVSAARDDPTPSGVRIPIVMADLIGALRASSHDLIHVQVGSGEGNNIAAYPPVTDTLLAGEWNRAAGANNRIEIRVH